MSMFRIADLGPIRVVHVDGEHPCSGAKQAAILSTLAMNVNRRVPIDELVVAAWGYEANVSASTVENQVWRLRRLLDPAYARAASSSLVNDSGGYRLGLANHELDSSAFEGLADLVRSQLAEGRAADAVRSCDDALRLWRGVPYGVVAHLSAAGAATARLEELRGHLLERRIKGLIMSGDLDRAVADLELLTAQFPFRERLWSLQMSALAGSGRVEQALHTYVHVRTMLRDELGLEPSRELQEVQRDILAANERPIERHTTTRRPPVSLTRVHLPRRQLPLFGRKTELSELGAAVGRNALVTVTGSGGCGKTRLSIEVARSVADGFRDGTWFVDLTAITDPDQVADAVASTLRLAAPGLDATAALADYLSARRVLLVLDNCEHVLAGAARFCRAVTEFDSSSVILATSRQPLAVDGELVWPLAPLPIGGADSTNSGAVALFVARANIDEADVPNRDVIAQICAAVDGLPLAIELAAARTQVFSLGEILDQVTQDPTRLTRIGRGEADHRTSVLSAIEWSYRLLDPVEQAVHRRLSVLPGPFVLPTATAVAQASDLEVDDVPGALARLVHRSLLVNSLAPRAGRPTVFRQLDTVRAHGGHQLEAAGEALSTRARRDRWVLQLLTHQPRLGEQDSLVFYDNLDDAYPTVRATFRTLVTREPDVRLLGQAARLLFYWYHRGVTGEARGWLQAVADTARFDPEPGRRPPAVTAFQLTLAGTHLLGGTVDEARRQLDLALPAVDLCPEDGLIDVGEALVGAGCSAWARNDYGLARLVDERLRVVAARSGDADLQMLSDHVACVAGFDRHDLHATAALAESVHADSLRRRNLLAQWQSGAARMVVADLSGDPEAGIRWTDRLIPAHVRFGSGGGGAFLEALANFAVQTDDFELAARMYGAAHAEIRRVGMVWPMQIRTDGLVRQTRATLGPKHFDSLWATGQLITYAEVAQERGLARPEADRNPPA